MKVFSSIGSSEDKVPISNVITPAGHTPNIFDVSRSFHFAAILPAVVVCEDLTDDEEFSLLGSYASQSQSYGAWEWALYVSLCRLKVRNPYQATLLIGRRDRLSRYCCLQ